jgi:uncharacterized protein YjcR
MRFSDLCCMATKQQATKKKAKKKAATPGKKRSKPHPMRRVAKELYLSGEYTLTEISEQLGVSTNTLGLWKIEDKWEWEKGIRENSSKEIIGFLYEQILLLKETCVDKAGNQRAMNAKEADTLVKVSNSIEKLSQRLSASTAMEAYVKLNNIIKSSDVELAKRMLPFQTEVLKQLA